MTWGRLYRENKGHWLTIRHQGRIYVMLGERREATPVTAEALSQAPESPGRRSPSATPTQPPVTLAFVAPEKVRAGEATDLAVSFTMRPGWYIYAPTGRNAQQGMIETGVTFELPDGVLATGGRRLPPAPFQGALRHLRGRRPAVGSARRGHRAGPARGRRQGYLPDLHGRPLPAAKNRDPAHDADRGWRRLTPDRTWGLRLPRVPRARRDPVRPTFRDTRDFVPFRTHAISVLQHPVKGRTASPPVFLQ